MRSNTDIVRELLGSTTNPERVRELCDPDVTYVSLNYSHPDLKRIMPWCGTSKSPQAIIDTFTRVAQFWSIDSFTPEQIFGEDEYVAVFGRFTYTSTVMKRQVISPFSIFCRLRNGKVYYMQFMEDTLATSTSFKSGGKWTFRSDPKGSEVEF